MNRESSKRFEAINRNMKFMNVTKNVYELEKLYNSSINHLFDVASMNVYNEDEKDVLIELMEKYHNELHECYRKNLRRL